MTSDRLQLSFSVPQAEATRSRQAYREALHGRADANYADPAEDAAFALLHECLRGDIAVTYKGQTLFAVRRDDDFPVPETVLLMTAAAERAVKDGYAMVGLGEDHVPLEFWRKGRGLEMQWYRKRERLRFPAGAATEGLGEGSRRVRQLINEAVPEALSDRYLGAWLLGREVFPKDFVTAGP